MCDLPIRVLAWELTRRCPMACKHCRGASRDESYCQELTTQECFRVIESLHTIQAHPLIIFTGGEPMYRPDLEAIVSYAATRGFPCVLAPCGRFATKERLLSLKVAGIRALSISIDGPDAASHDTFRGVPGAFDFACQALQAAHSIELPFQINHCVTRNSLTSLRQMRNFAFQHGATRIDYFFLVPIGRGEAIAQQCLTQEETETALQTILDLDAEGTLPVHVTCEPSVLSIAEKRRLPPHSRFNGCMAGAGFCFLSHVGQLRPCGFFPENGGDLHHFDFDLPKTYLSSPLFAQLHGGRACLARALAQSTPRFHV
mgnify:CR=1 FL=1